ncbi:MAG: M14-type cytosolic carboxypeptidase [Bacteroidales bacterium]|jgi:murein tripeptide amidase MpaA|nr:M14-type cytosolic carboxypeptidase [Bacteroidales bacterium]MDD2630887.1 M14-type cytosolic carboxypeptidase [Bacteroidales bacterium]MDD3526711.1 M14-type cytosolic carboxypeptidase [Bacteroidales bacterium]MDD4176587.1 M14-type cytosolic carboxypeptidase [Bacteroidales bacterium]MDD4742370.1 M14-type cytosolic carboxypeptidase [Bacteroidales bacterium]
MKIHISSQFDAGNIEVVDASDAQNITLNIRKDTQADTFQWFYFRVTGGHGQALRMKILNAGQASYPEGWKDYMVRASYDTEDWFMVPTRFDDGQLIIDHTPAYNSVFYAYFAPYSYERHLEFVSNVQYSPLVNFSSLGSTVQGRSIDLLTIGDEHDEAKKIWIIARQHPGESQVSYFMEALISRLVDIDDPVSRTLLNKAVFYVVPFVNPDGAVAGNLRANAAGLNLNREWANPDPQKAPEVYHILQAMQKTGVDLNLDIHADEDLPYNFISSIEGIPSFDERLKNLLEKFKNSWLEISPDFQTEHSYPVNAPGTANLNICSKAIGERFKCLSMTIEMPFKDHATLPDPVYGWSPARSEKFGHSLVNVIGRVIDEL